MNSLNNSNKKTCPIDELIKNELKIKKPKTIVNTMNKVFMTKSKKPINKIKDFDLKQSKMVDIYEKVFKKK